MSKSLNSIKQRRAVAQPVMGPPSGQGRMNPQTQPPQTQQQQQQTPPSPSAGLTLPQVIALIDNRLVVLERFMNETNANRGTMAQNTGSVPPPPTPSEQPQGIYVSSDEFSENMLEFDNRFQLLATEIANLKDVVLSLQKYTMDVNKMLLESQTNAPEEQEESAQNIQFTMSSLVEESSVDDSAAESE